MNENLPINYIRYIENYVSGVDECESVAVLVAADDEFSAQKAIELINAAPQMYEALHYIQSFINCEPDDAEEMREKLDTIVARAIAAAHGEKDRVI
jgi:DNA-directed RNA polymerase subunit F